MKIKDRIDSENKKKMYELRDYLKKQEKKQEKEESETNEVSNK